MERAKTVDDLLREKGVTPAEEEQLREVIEECRMREADIKKASESARENMEKLADTLKMIVDTFAVVSNSVDELHNEVQRLQLRMIPEEHFYRE
jgi:archaellum component FlaC